MQYSAKIAGVLGTLLLLGMAFPCVTIAQLSAESGFTFEPDSVSTGATLDLVFEDPGPVDSILFDGNRAHIVDTGGTLARVIVPDRIPVNSRPFVKVYLSSGEFSFRGPYIVRYNIESVEPRYARPGQGVRVFLSRYVDATPADSFASRSVEVSLDGSLTEAFPLSARSLEFLLPETVESSFIEKLRGSAAPEVQVFIAGEPSVPYQDYRVDLPWTTSRILVWFAVLYGALLVLYMPFYYYRFQSRRRRQNVWSEFERERAAIADNEEKIPPKPPEAPPDGLTNALAAGECILFASGGLAAQAGLPTWPAFLYGLVEFGRSRGLLDVDNAKRLQRSLREDQIDLVAEELSSLLSTDDLRAYVEEIQQGIQPSDAHRLLAELPFAGALTTCFDTLLSDAFDEEPLIPEDTERLLEAVRDRTFFVLNLFGAVEQSAELSFTPEDLNRHVKQNPQFRQFISTLFQRYTFFFVGCSLEGIRIYLKDLELSHQQSRSHYALVGAPQGVDTTMARSLERLYNVQTIDFRPHEDYPEVVDFLKQMHAAQPTRERRRSRTGTSPVLDRIVLTNIGPFEKLDLSFNSSWNVFLGDNGVGKTIILRAIAAALCGESIRDAPLAVRESVQGLLQAGTDRGEIQLHAGSQAYVVTLEKDATRQVRAVSENLSPLLFDNWLVLGFPALRSITRERPMGHTEASEKAQHPALEDLYPILAGTPDARLNNLKQWVINLDHRRARGDQIAGETLKSFWKLLDVLTPDIRLQPPEAEKAIDAKTGEITLETDDGKVPLEVVSQGTASLICWAGTLLQRLYEIHEAGGGDPQEGGAIVLIDEIAAHMHPSWQRYLVLALKKQFHNVQFVVNTHLPFIVLGVTDPAKPMSEAASEEALDEEEPKEKAERVRETVAPHERSEIIVMRRDPLSRQIQAQQPRLDLRRLRVNQVLTSPLFNLGSTLHPDIEKAEQTYSKLAHRANLTQGEKKRLEEASRLLTVPPPSPHENEEAATVFRKIEAALNKELGDMEPEKKKRMLEEARMQVQEMVSGKRRPS